ncbi:PREDICTED: alpha-N-acetylgalactosaminidase [Nicrophorus vespilloides]|uniref:Alpha-galactosidase n=1 Tax=Nicrophorus vespilloides TaxID=110193 RepID=A0ABM1ML29_NICVS|nr:PREDICTED: alpha-N-acetylgalactosaminidase [Nicrophorus vespilloides]
MIQIIFFCLMGISVYALDNGLAIKPPMGWMHWQRFRCVIDCETYPDECVSEDLFRKMADIMESEGYLNAGYNYIIVDDCWMDKNRANDNRLQADPIRFKSGMKSLGDYIHSKGLKFGIYGDYGTHTCAGYPGSLNYLELDAQTFADWGVDYVKLDGCYSDPDTMVEGYAAFGNYLNKTKRPMVYSCSWPAYQEPDGHEADYDALKKTCNLWRNWDDIDDSWSSVSSIIDWFTKHQDRLAPHSGPGHWNDPDMLIIGNYGLSEDQSKAQMAIWSIMAAPLIMSNDLRAMKTEFKNILLNKEAIGINQDALGIQGKLIASNKKVNLWTKPILPKVDGYFSQAVGLVSNRTDGFAYLSDFKLDDIGLDAPNGYTIQNIFENEKMYTIPPHGSISARVPPNGGVLLKLVPIPKKHL